MTQRIPWRFCWVQTNACLPAHVSTAIATDSLTRSLYCFASRHALFFRAARPPQAATCEGATTSDHQPVRERSKDVRHTHLMLSGLLFWTASGLRLPDLHQVEYCQELTPAGARLKGIVFQAGVRRQSQDTHSRAWKACPVGSCPESLLCAEPCLQLNVTWKVKLSPPRKRKLRLRLEVTCLSGPTC